MKTIQENKLMRGKGYPHEFTGNKLYIITGKINMCSVFRLYYDNLTFVANVS